ncbi:unnamed protein product [Cylindrotheca closterium]|uniref:Uncharacterized protein n=1 Tax=Cylindrotheca closterium TaxID=2856 RepID=A0AAD2PUC8_9STRA|nr:unnamed protein product [Cylindrotheca closterium]
MTNFNSNNNNNNTRLSFRPLQWIFLLSLFLTMLPSGTHALIELRTSAKTNQMTAAELQDYLSRPIHWPQIVGSSDSVKCLDGYNENDPLQVGNRVKEFFGMNLLSVTWTCTKNEPGKLVVKAPEGLPGIAKECSMKFDITNVLEKNGEATAKVVLTMGYDPVSPIALAATPVLVLDNWMALKVLLPRAINKQSNN